MKLKVSLSTIIMCVIVGLFLSFARASLLVLLPLIPFILYFLFPFRVKKDILPLLLLALVFGVLGIYNETTSWANYLVSTSLLFSLLIIFFSRPMHVKSQWPEIKRVVINLIFGIIILNNIIGIIQFSFNPFGHYPGEDAFIGFYGRHGTAQHGLAILNGYFVLFYFIKIFYKYDHKNLLKLFFFLISHILCFYGLGLMVLLIVIIAYVVINSFSFRNILVVFSVVFSIYLTFSFLFEGTFFYLLKNLMYLNVLFNDSVIEKVYLPSKVKVFLEYHRNFHWSQDFWLFIAGTGPGGFNSRVSFLLNSDSNNFISWLLGGHMPIYHKEIVHPMWDIDFISMRSFNDGTRNQPFSSVISLLAEYGFLFTILLFYFIWKEIRALCQATKNSQLKNFIIIGWGYCLLHIIFDNYIDYSEFWVFIVFLFFVKIDNASHRISLG